MNVVGWSGPYPILSRKRPTADLVSRKVLVPLIGQIVISVLMQFTTYKAVRSQPWSVSLIYAT
jgi:cation-transporting P-type ATPase 13A2